MSKKRLLFKKERMIQRVVVEDSSNETAQALEALEFSWNDTSHNMSYEERFMFLDVTERVLKIHDRIKGALALEDRMSKN